jgi:hypothetical protein
MSYSALHSGETHSQSNPLSWYGYLLACPYAIVCKPSESSPQLMSDTVLLNMELRNAF